jgi:hypothetical protein
MIRLDQIKQSEPTMLGPDNEKARTREREEAVGTGFGFSTMLLSKTNLNVGVRAVLHIEYR